VDFFLNCKTIVQIPNPVVDRPVILLEKFHSFQYNCLSLNSILMTCSPEDLKYFSLCARLHHLLRSKLPLYVQVLREDSMPLSGNWKCFDDKNMQLYHKYKEPGSAVHT